MRQVLRVSCFLIYISQTFDARPEFPYMLPAVQKGTYGNCSFPSYLVKCQQLPLKMHSFGLIYFVYCNAMHM